MDFNQNYWQQRWESGQIGWDIGYPSTPIKEYIDQLDDKQARILIPGCGNGYEAAYLAEQGYEHTHVIDISSKAVDLVRQKLPASMREQVIHGDFFEHSGQYDLIFEQTFFCALDPSLRSQYITHMHSLLSDGGCIVGVMFNIPLYDDHPPFGGSEALYRELFSTLFDIEIMEEAHNSIPSRLGNELFVRFRKK